MTGTEQIFQIINSLGLADSSDIGIDIAVDENLNEKTRIVFTECQKIAINSQLGPVAIEYKLNIHLYATSRNTCENAKNAILQTCKNYHRILEEPVLGATLASVTLGPATTDGGVVRDDVFVLSIEISIVESC